MPPQAFDGWNRLTRFPDGALERFWELMQPALADHPETVGRARAFAEGHAIRPEDLEAALEATLFLVRHAVSCDLDSESFAEDLARISGPLPRAGELVARGYADDKPRLREALFERALLAHGDVLVGLDWRVDTIRATRSAAKLDYEVVLLTLHVRRGDTVEQRHVQVAPGALAMIRDFARTFGEG